jgi:hypothetical protein
MEDCHWFQHHVKPNKTCYQHQDVVLCDGHEGPFPQIVGLFLASIVVAQIMSTI